MPSSLVEYPFSVRDVVRLSAVRTTAPRRSQIRLEVTPVAGAIYDLCGVRAALDWRLHVVISHGGRAHFVSMNERRPTRR